MTTTFIPSEFGSLKSDNYENFLIYIMAAFPRSVANGISTCIRRMDNKKYDQNTIRTRTNALILSFLGHIATNDCSSNNFIFDHTKAIQSIEYPENKSMGTKRLSQVVHPEANSAPPLTHTHTSVPTNRMTGKEQ